MEQVWVAQVYEDGYRDRRTCREHSHGNPECGGRLVKVQGREFRWHHTCNGLLHGPEKVFTALVHGWWRSALSLQELDRYADAMPAPEYRTAVEDSEPLADVVDLDTRRHVAA